MMVIKYASLPVSIHYDITTTTTATIFMCVCAEKQKTKIIKLYEIEPTKKENSN